MRLIDADALTENSEFVVAVCNLVKCCGMKHNSGCLAPNCENCFARFFKHYQHLAPTIEAKPVKHGKWKEYPALWECSNCKSMMSWISVKDKKPDVNEYGWAYVIVSDGETTGLAGYSRNGDYFNVFSDEYNLYKVKYWMPLPEPPERRKA